MSRDSDLDLDNDGSIVMSNEDGEERNTLYVFAEGRRFFVGEFHPETATVMIVGLFAVAAVAVVILLLCWLLLLFLLLLFICLSLLL